MRTLALLCFATLVGCDNAAPNYRLLSAPPAESPVVNPHLSIRKTNWLGGPSGREGSCVHASLSSLLHWQNEFELARDWRASYSGGEYSDRLRRRLDAAGVRYAYTENTNLELLDFAHATRRGAILWWKPAHCCTFVGWTTGSDGRVYATILDNNSVNKYEYTEKSQFHRLWASYGGFALTPLFDPPSPPIWLSYERGE